MKAKAGFQRDDTGDGKALPADQRDVLTNVWCAPVAAEVQSVMMPLATL
jgi:hypothetical protein